jgi:6-phosphogluconolactonase
MANIRRFSSIDGLTAAAADAFCAVAADAMRARGRFVCALAGGHTPELLYTRLASPSHRDRLDWEHASFFFGDERAVPPDDAQSNYQMAWAHLLGQVPVRPDHVHRIAIDDGDTQTAAERYAALVCTHVATAHDASGPAFDLVLLGLGADAHTASLFPYSPALGVMDQWFVPSTSPVAPFARVTATAPLINSARQVFVLVAGMDKAPALARVLQGPFDPPRYPAQLVAGHPGLTWFVDAAAAQLLSPPPHTPTRPEMPA